MLGNGEYPSEKHSKIGDALAVLWRDSYPEYESMPSIDTLLQSVPKWVCLWQCCGMNHTPSRHPSSTLQECPESILLDCQRSSGHLGHGLSRTPSFLCCCCCCFSVHCDCSSFHHRQWHLLPRMAASPCHRLIFRVVASHGVGSEVILGTATTCFTAHGLRP